MPIVIVIAVIAFALHIGAALALPLIEDEAYYALWASVPSWGYYDHPPMIAWMIAVGTRFFGPEPWAVRLIPMLSIAVTTVIVGDMARIVGGTGRHAAWAAAFFSVGFAAMGLGAFATPDSPSILWWAACLWAAIRAASGGGMVWWAAAGIGAGLGVQSKFTALFLAVGLFGWLVATREGRRQMATPRPYLAALAALLVIAPLAAWNAANGWIGLERQFGRIDAGTFAPLGIVAFWATAILLPTPLIAGMTATGAATGRSGNGKALILWTTVPVLAYLTYHAATHAVPANWTAPLQPGFAVLAALAIDRARPRTPWISALTGAGLTIATLGWLFFAPSPVGTGHNPPNQVRGWGPLVAEIEAARAASGAKWIATTHYGLTGTLWARLQGTPVYAVTEEWRYRFRGGIPTDLCGQSALLIERLDVAVPDAGGLFSLAVRLPDLHRVSQNQILATYRIHAVRGLKDTSLCR